MKTIKHLKGQTIIEALIAFAIIAISAVALIKFQQYLSHDSSLAEQKSEATLLAIKQIETLRDFQVLNNKTGFTSYQSIATGTSTSTVNNTNYTLNWTVTANTSPMYKTINVVTSWTDRTNSTQSVTLSTNIAGIDPAYSSSVM